MPKYFSFPLIEWTLNSEWFMLEPRSVYFLNGFSIAGVRHNTRVTAQTKYRLTTIINLKIKPNIQASELVLVTGHLCGKSVCRNMLIRLFCYDVKCKNITQESQMRRWTVTNIMAVMPFDLLICFHLQLTYHVYLKCKHATLAGIHTEVAIFIPIWIHP